MLLKIDQLIKIAVKMTKGDLDDHWSLTDKDELGIFGRTFDKKISQLADSLVTLATTKTQMELELNVAKDIQMSMVPLTFPAYPEHAEFEHICPTCSRSRSRGRLL